MSEQDLNKQSAEFSKEDSAARIAQLEAMLAERERKLAEREQELRRALTDRVTGLRQRHSLYQMLSRAFEETLTAATCADVNQALDAASALAALERCNRDEIERTELSVLFADVAYLTFVNRGGHAAGDALLAGIGDVARTMGSPVVELPDREPNDAPVVFFRHGGDEITALIRETTQEARRTAEHFQTLASRREIPVLERYGLRPRVDVGVAHIREGIEALRLLLERGENVPAGDRMAKMADLTVAIADRRASVQKGIERVRLLIGLRADKPDVYAEVINSLRKGAYDVTDAEIDEFIRRQAAGEAMRPAIHSFVLERADRAFREAQVRAEHEYEVVRQIADRSEAV